MADIAGQALDDELDDFQKLPGLFRRWELANLVELGPDYHFEEAGTTTDGEELIAVYMRAAASELR